MEFAEKGDLRSVLKKHIVNDYEPIDEELIWKWFSQIALAVKYLHSKKIIHRDIKVENIFITEDNNVKLGDFGVSKELENSMDLANSGVGTPYYLSPEICEGLKYNFKTDIWMMGCLLYEMCTLKKPFKSDSIKLLIKSIVNKDPDEIRNSKYSENLLNLINLMLRKRPEERPTIEEVWVRIYMFSKLNLTSLPIKILDKNKLKIDVEEESSENTAHQSPADDNNFKLTPISSIEMDYRHNKLEQNINVNSSKYTPVYCKKDISKILKNMQISPISNPVQDDSINKRSVSTTTPNSTPGTTSKIDTIKKMTNKNENVTKINTNNISANPVKKTPVKNFKNRHYRHISINISSVQSPEHRAIYEIENIEEIEKLEFPSPINLCKNSIIHHNISKIKVIEKQTMTPPNLTTMKGISPKEKLIKKEIPNSTKVGKTEESMIRKSLVKSFLIERYSKGKFELMYNQIIARDKICEKAIREIVGEDYKVAINYLKYLTGKK